MAEEEPAHGLGQTVQAHAAEFKILPPLLLKVSRSHERKPSAADPRCLNVRVRNRPPRLSSLVCWRHLGSCPLQSFQMCLHVSVDPRLYIFLVWTPDEIILFVLF